MSLLKDLRLYSTHNHPCSYLPEQSAKTLFVDPEVIVSTHQHSQLSEMGFRRSGSHYYRPYCDYCKACIPCRLPVEQFQASRRFRRILRMNQDIQISLTEKIDSDEYYQLYHQYINTRHHDGDMYPATREQYDSFLATSCISTIYYEMRNQSGKLMGLIVCDQLDNGLSAVYTYFDPDERKRSLGTLAILWQIEEALRMELPYLYLGYWIRDSVKMNYKTQYRPVELFINKRWIKLS